MEPRVQYLSVIPTMTGLAVSGVTKAAGKREPDLYDTKREWYEEQAQMIDEHASQVAVMTREPNECGTDEELVMVLVYEDGRIIDASDLVTDYRIIFDRDNTS